MIVDFGPPPSASGGLWRGKHFGFIKIRINMLKI
jgi:hypothetical protein